MTSIAANIAGAILASKQLNGKFLFADNMNKLNCISYDDGSKMSNFTKYRVLNYFSKWLMTNQLLSDDTTATFEKL